MRPSRRLALHRTLGDGTDSATLRLLHIGTLARNRSIGFGKFFFSIFISKGVENSHTKKSQTKNQQFSDLTYFFRFFVKIFKLRNFSSSNLGVIKVVFSFFLRLWPQKVFHWKNLHLLILRCSLSLCALFTKKNFPLEDSNSTLTPPKGYTIIHSAMPAPTPENRRFSPDFQF